MSENLRAYTTVMFGFEQTHTWDIATGAGIDANFDRQMVSLILDDYLARDMAPLRVPQRYDAERSVGDDSDELVRLIAFTGRDPEWQPT